MLCGFHDFKVFDFQAKETGGSDNSMSVGWEPAEIFVNVIKNQSFYL
jgi:hypothetical protein